jgi:hypothetical protein
MVWNGLRSIYHHAKVEGLFVFVWLLLMEPEAAGLLL